MNKFVILLIIGAFFAGTYLPQSAKKTCTPTFADGGGPYYKANSPFRTVLYKTDSRGEILAVSGRVLHRDCQTPLPNAIVDIWHADENGKYQDDWYRGRILTDANGNYTFETIIPKGYGEGTGYRPPHIHFKIISNNTELITSQMFFPEVAGKAGFDEAYIIKTDKTIKNGRPMVLGYHDIIVP